MKFFIFLTCETYVLSWDSETYAINW
jgi:hypothetical protein